MLARHPIITMEGRDHGFNFVGSWFRVKGSVCNRRLIRFCLGGDPLVFREILIARIFSNESDGIGFSYSDFVIPLVTSFTTHCEYENSQFSLLLHDCVEDFYVRTTLCENGVCFNTIISCDHCTTLNGSHGEYTETDDLDREQSVRDLLDRFAQALVHVDIESREDFLLAIYENRPRDAEDLVDHRLPPHTRPMLVRRVGLILNDDFRRIPFPTISDPLVRGINQELLLFVYSGVLAGLPVDALMGQWLVDHPPHLAHDGEEHKEQVVPPVDEGVGLDQQQQQQQQQEQQQPPEQPVLVEEPVPAEIINSIEQIHTVLAFVEDQNRMMVLRHVFSGDLLAAEELVRLPPMGRPGFVRRLVFLLNPYMAMNIDVISRSLAWGEEMPMFAFLHTKMVAGAAFDDALQMWIHRHDPEIPADVGDQPAGDNVENPDDEPDEPPVVAVDPVLDVDDPDYIRPPDAVRAERLIGGPDDGPPPPVANPVQEDANHGDWCVICMNDNVGARNPRVTCRYCRCWVHDMCRLAGLMDHCPTCRIPGSFPNYTNIPIVRPVGFQPPVGGPPPPDGGAGPGGDPDAFGWIPGGEATIYVAYPAHTKYPHVKELYSHRGPKYSRYSMEGVLETYYDVDAGRNDVIINAAEQFLGLGPAMFTITQAFRQHREIPQLIDAITQITRNTEITNVLLNQVYRVSVSKETIIHPDGYETKAIRHLPLLHPVTQPPGPMPAFSRVLSTFLPVDCDARRTVPKDFLPPAKSPSGLAVVDPIFDLSNYSYENILKICQLRRMVERNSRIFLNFHESTSQEIMPLSDGFGITVVFKPDNVLLDLESYRFNQQNPLQPIITKLAGLVSFYNYSSLTTTLHLRRNAQMSNMLYGRNYDLRATQQECLNVPVGSKVGEFVQQTFMVHTGTVSRVMDVFKACPFSKNNYNRATQLVNLEKINYLSTLRRCRPLEYEVIERDTFEYASLSGAKMREITAQTTGPYLKFRSNRAEICLDDSRPHVGTTPLPYLKDYLDTAREHFYRFMFEFMRVVRLTLRNFFGPGFVSGAVIGYLSSALLIVNSIAFYMNYRVPMVTMNAMTFDILPQMMLFAFVILLSVVLFIMSILMLRRAYSNLENSSWFLGAMGIVVSILTAFPVLAVLHGTFAVFSKSLAEETFKVTMTSYFDADIHVISLFFALFEHVVVDSWRFGSLDAKLLLLRVIVHGSLSFLPFKYRVFCHLVINMFSNQFDFKFDLLQGFEFDSSYWRHYYNVDYTGFLRINAIENLTGMKPDQAPKHGLKLKSSTRGSFDPETGEVSFEVRDVGQNIDSNLVVKQHFLQVFGFTTSILYYDKNSVGNLEKASRRFCTASPYDCPTIVKNWRRIVKPMIPEKNWFEPLNTDRCQNADDYASAPHPKKAIRQRFKAEVDENATLWFHRDKVNKGEVKNEIRGRHKKNPRLFVSLGMQIVFYGLYSAIIKTVLATDYYRKRFLYPDGSELYVTFAYGWSLKTLTDEFSFIQQVRGVHLWLFSDDCYLVDNRSGRCKYYGMDISSCDQSHTVASFELARRYLKSFDLDVDEYDELVNDNFEDLVLFHPAGPSYGRLLFENTRKVGLCSGSGLTTFINSFALCMIAEHSTRENFSEDFFIQSAADLGFKLESSGITTAEESTFLRTFPCLATDGRYYFIPCVSLMCNYTRIVNPDYFGLDTGSSTFFPSNSTKAGVRMQGMARSFTGEQALMNSMVSVNPFSNISRKLASDLRVSTVVSREEHQIQFVLQDCEHTLETMYMRYSSVVTLAEFEVLLKQFQVLHDRGLYHTTSSEIFDRVYEYDYAAKAVPF